MGGATVGISMVDTNDADYTAAKDENKTVLSLALEF